MTPAVRSDATAPESGPAPQDSLADQLVEELAALGVSTYFGVPGGAIEPLFNALARGQRAGHARLVPMRSEGGAAFAADGYYRATGRMAACAVTTGPGISNLLTATMAAHADRIPLLLLTPQVALGKQGRGALQESSLDGYDMPGAFSACTRYSTIVTDAEQLPHKLGRAMAAATYAPCGPVHLSIPSDILGGRRFRGRVPLVASTGPPRPTDDRAIEALMEGLLIAQAPVFYVGDDAGREAYRLCDVARRLRAKIVTSPAGKRWLGHHEPTYAGVVGFSGHPTAAEVLRSADLVVAFGATFDELSTNAWTAFPEVPIHSVDTHTNHVHRLPSAVPVVSDPAHVIRLIVERVHDRSDGKISTRSSPSPPLLRVGSGGPVHPADLMRWLGLRLPSDVVVHVDAGNGFAWSTRHLVRSQPDTYRVAMGLSTMAWAIGAVIGAAVGRPRRAVCVAGDGSMLMASLELTVAVQHNLSVTYVVLNDSSYGMVRHGQRLGQAESIAHELSPVRFDQLARACGAKGVRVESFEDLDCVPAEFLGSDDAGPCVVDVRVDPDAVPPIGDRVSGLAAGVSR